MALASAASIAACGGGGDLAGNRVTLPIGGTPGGGSGSGGSGTTSDGTISLVVVDQASGLTQNAISFTALSLAKVVVKDGNGVPVANAVVSFESSDEEEVVFLPADTALTDSSGAASVTVKPATISTAGAYSLYAIVEVGQKRLQTSFNVAVGAANVGLGTLSAGQSPLSAYGTTVLTVPITGVPASTPVSVRFSSNCAAQNPPKATIGAVVTSVNGTARTTYVDRGCGSGDLITATVEGTSVTQTAVLQVATPAVANIQFVSATPMVIALRGTGGVQGPGVGVRFPEISQVRFQVVDQAGNPVVSPTNVSLRLSNDTGGLLIDGVAGPIVKQTDANGFVEVQVQSGTLPTPLWVIATIATANTTLTTNSVQLAVSTGQPIQNRFTVTAPYYNIEGWSYDGEALPFRLRAADVFGNPVPDGTAISFIAGAGKIDANCQTGVNTGRVPPLPGDGDPGECGVEFVTQGERPIAGRGATIVAYAIGEEAFTDSNGNWRHDPGEPFFDQGNLFVDRSENGAHDPGEQAIPFVVANNGACGANPYTPSVPNTCDGQRGLAHVRDARVVVWSGSFASFRSSQSFSAPPNPSNIATSYPLNTSTCTVAVPFWLQDLNGNPMPYDTTVAARVLSIQGDNRDLWAAEVQNERIGSTIARGGTAHGVIVTKTQAGGCAGVSGSAEIKVTTPKNNVTTFVFSF